MIELAKEGKNVLVDACIGSGKTTSIQKLCDVLSGKILYLTYNKLLKADAKRKIKNKNAIVQNYHGYAYRELKRNGLNTGGISETIKNFIKYEPVLEEIDVLILDEYQDINEEISEMLGIIKAANPKMQMIVVGDMEQKIYDFTTLNVKAFIDKFLGDYEKVSFTKCFRINKKLGEKLGRIWNKKIDGINDGCENSIMTFDEAFEFLKSQSPKDILCLGSRYG